MVRAEVCWRGLASSRSIEHAAQPDAVDDAAMYAKAHDATRPLVHYDEHPVRAQDRRLASKQIETPQTVLRVTEDGVQDGPGESGAGRNRTARMRRTTSLLMAMPNARAIC